MSVSKPEIKWIGSPNFGYPRGTKGQNKPIAIVCHIMEGTLAGTDSWFQNPDSGASTTFGIGTNGEIHQYVALTDAAWGNGLVKNPSWSLLRAGENPNRYTVSIEFEGKHPNAAGGVFWAPNPAQIEAAAHLCAWLSQELAIPLDRDHVIGHYQIDGVSRANCPGPLFPFDRLVEAARRKLHPVIYRVQVGAFVYKDNAERLVAELKNKGYTDAFIVEAPR